jgi:multidrug efflux pump subunit AcrB
MRSFIAWWVRNPVAANLLMLGILIGGYLGLKNIEKEAFPGVQSDVIQVELVWPGASPQEVEQQLVQRVEEVLKDVNNVYRVNSTSSEGFGFVEVRTFPNVDLNAFLNDVKGAVDSITSFPRDIENPRVTRQQWRGEMIRVALIGDIGERSLTRLAQDLRNDLASQPYISQIELFGVRNEEVTIELSEEALRRYDVTFSEVAAAIRANSISVSSGEVRTRTGDIQLRATNLADSQVDFEKIVVRQSAAGGLIHVGDVAKVSDGFEENEILATLNGKPAVLLQVMSTDNMQIVKSSDSVKKWMAEVEPTLPQGVSLDLWQDNADIYNSRMDLITESSLLGLVLVFAVLLLTLRPKVALWLRRVLAWRFLGRLRCSRLTTCRSMLFQRSRFCWYWALSWTTPLWSVRVFTTTRTSVCRVSRRLLRALWRWVGPLFLRCLLRSLPLRPGYLSLVWMHRLLASCRS